MEAKKKYVIDVDKIDEKVVADQRFMGLAHRVNDVPETDSFFNFSVGSHCPILEPGSVLFRVRLGNLNKCTHSFLERVRLAPQIGKMQQIPSSRFPETFLQRLYALAYDGNCSRRHHRAR